MKTINFSNYAYNAIIESIKAVGNENISDVINYYGDLNECTFEDYFKAQISNGNLYDATDVFDEENLIGSIEDNDFESDFADAREKAFREWFEELVEDVDIDDLIDVTDEVVVTPVMDSDDEGNEFVLYTEIEYNGKMADMTDTETEASGDILFSSIFYRHMGEYGNQDVRKAAILAGAKYVYSWNSESTADWTLCFWK